MSGGTFADKWAAWQDAIFSGRGNVEETENAVTAAIGSVVEAIQHDSTEPTS